METKQNDNPVEESPVQPYPKYFRDLDGDVFKGGELRDLYIITQNRFLRPTKYKLKLKFLNRNDEWVWTYGTMEEAIKEREHLLRVLVEPKNIPSMPDTNEYDSTT